MDLEQMRYIWEATLRKFCCILLQEMTREHSDISAGRNQLGVPRFSWSADLILSNVESSWHGFGATNCVWERKRLIKSIDIIITVAQKSTQVYILNGDWDSLTSSCLSYPVSPNSRLVPQTRATRFIDCWHLPSTGHLRKGFTFQTTGYFSFLRSK